MFVPRMNVLAAYPYLKDRGGMRARLVEALGRHPERYRLIVDSGAYTVWTLGTTLDLGEYVAFLRSLASELPRGLEWRAVQLDVFGDPARTYANWRRMLDAGLADVMPVFTRGDTPERLEEFYAATDYVMFGGIVVGGKNLNYVKWFMDRNGARKVHWLGFCQIPFVQHYRPESVDSSSWMGQSRFGGLAYYAGAGLIKTVKKGWPLPPQVDAAVRRLGFAPGDIARLRDPEAWRGSAGVALTAGPGPVRWREGSSRGVAPVMSVAAHLQRMVQVEMNLGTRFYQAVSVLHWMQAMFAIFELLLERGVIKEQSCRATPPA